MGGTKRVLVTLGARDHLLLHQKSLSEGIPMGRIAQSVLHAYLSDETVNPDDPIFHLGAIMRGVKRGRRDSKDQDDILYSTPTKIGVLRREGVLLKFSTITISYEAYRRLAAQRRSAESLTDVVIRLTEQKSLARFAGNLSPSSARRLRSAISADRLARSRLDRKHAG